jgi:hypothetical protein
MRVRLALAASILTLLVYWLTWSGLPHAIDELSTLSVTESMAIGDGFAVNQMEWDQSRTPPQNAPGLDGRLYSKKGLGMSLLALPGWLVGGAVGDTGAARGALLAGPVVSALGVGAIVWVALALGFGTVAALLAGLALALGSLQWPYARTLFGEALAGPALAIALAGALGARTFSPAWGQMRRSTPTLRTLALLACGSGLALITLAKSSNGIVAPFVLLLVAVGAWQAQPGDRPRDRWLRLLREGFIAALPFVLAVGVTVWYNWTRFGTLFGFALEPYEDFSTPVIEGVTGLLLSSGKGLLWYMPVAWLGLAGLGMALLGRGRPGPLAGVTARRGLTALDALALLGVIVAPVLLYALWYDWPGGRSWGPRMIAWTGPAFVVLALPVLAILADRKRPLALRLLIGVVLAASVLIQLPGVLVNFELREAFDTREGVPFEALLWEPAQSPLFTYWRSMIPGNRPFLLDPLILQPVFWADVMWVLPLALLAVAGALLWAGVRQAGRRSAALLGAALAVALLVGPAMAATTGDDPRWRDRGANAEDNVAVATLLRGAAPADAPELLLHDLNAFRDMQSRVWWRANSLPAPPAFIGWLRKEPMDGAAGERLDAMLAGNDLFWVVIQETTEDDPKSTTERWLNEAAFRGRSQWVGAQRVVEYAMDPGAEPGTAMATGGAVAYSDGVTLTDWALRRSANDRTWLLDLEWEGALSPDLRVSLQALDAGGALITQVDRAPGLLEGTRDRVALPAPAESTLLLKLYRATDGSLLQGPQGDALLLVEAGGP